MARYARNAINEPRVILPASTSRPPTYQTIRPPRLKMSAMMAVNEVVACSTVTRDAPQVFARTLKPVKLARLLGKGLDHANARQHSRQRAGLPAAGIPVAIVTWDKFAARRKGCPPRPAARE